MGEAEPGRAKAKLNAEGGTENAKPERFLIAGADVERQNTQRTVQGAEPAKDLYA